MHKNNVLKIAFLSASAAVMLFAFVPAHTTFAATGCEDLQANIDALKEGGQSSPLDGLPRYCTANTLLRQVILIGFYIAGGVAVLFVMIGGFQYMIGMSTGGDEAIGKAKKTITYALLGLVIVVLAGTIVTIILNLITTNRTGSSSSSTPNANPTPSVFDPKPPGTGTGNPPGSGSPTTQPPSSDAIVYSVVEAPGNSTPNFKFYNITVTGSEAALIKKCGTATPDATVFVDSDEVKSANFNNGSVSFSSVPAPGPDSISVSVCGDYINRKN